MPFRCYSATDLRKSLLPDSRTHLIRPRRKARQGKEDDDRSVNDDYSHLSHISPSREEMAWIGLSAWRADKFLHHPQISVLLLSMSASSIIAR